MKHWKWLSHNAINNGQKGDFETDSLNKVKQLARQWEDSIIIEQFNEKYSFIRYKMTNGRLKKIV